jgi:hypothetical protein
MLETDVSELEKRYAAAQEPLQILEAKRRSIIKKLENSIEETKEQVTYKTKNFCRELAPQIKIIAQEYKLENEIKLLFTDPRPSIEAAVKEVTDFLVNQIEEGFLSWQKSEVEPFLLTRMEYIKNSLDAEATEFIQRIDNLRLEVSGVSVANINISKGDVGVRDVSAMERVLSAAGGFLVGGLGSATIGATFGYQEMLKSLIPQLAIAIASYIFLGLNPITLVPMLVAALIQGKLMEGGIANKIKEEVGKKFSEQLGNTTVDIIDKVSSSISTELSKVKNIVDEGLGAEIESIRLQVNNVLTEKRKGQSEVDKRIKQLEVLSQQVNQIDRELDDLITQVAITGSNRSI